MVDSKEKYKFDLGIKGLIGVWVLYQDRCYSAITIHSVSVCKLCFLVIE